jgi:hypothetical protein
MVREAVVLFEDVPFCAGPDAPRLIPARGWTGEGEVFAAGFLHRDRWDDVPAGAGFAAGGFMDDLAAGPLLAALISEATAATSETQSYAALGESELIGVLNAWRRLASWAAAAGGRDRGSVATPAREGPRARRLAPVRTHR